LSLSDLFVNIINVVGYKTSCNQLLISNLVSFVSGGAEIKGLWQRLHNIQDMKAYLYKILFFFFII